MRELTCTTGTKICVGYDKDGKNWFRVYDAKTDSCEKLSKKDVKELLENGVNITNLYLSHNKIRCTYDKDGKVTFSGATVVGVVNKSSTNKSIVGYNIVHEDGSKKFMGAEEVYAKAMGGFICNMQNDNRDGICHKYLKGGNPLYVRYIDENLSDIDEQSQLDILKNQLIDVLHKMNKIRPVQFHDIDCDDCVYNFSDVTISEGDNRVYIEIAMWHDNLPVHAEHPLKDGRGREILPKK